ncbi:MAG: N-acetylmuramoyl-L-alanine amidase [Chitinophagales bacterium]|nr:N-acetylmuramoyl-L-alanine amidase [Chitinophagales bacterium]
MRKIFFLVIVLISTHTLKAQENFRYARTTGKLPMMAYSLGEDRLGSAKMNIIDTNILIKIFDSTNNMYLVQLAKNHTAYLEKKYTKLLETTQLKNVYLTNAFTVKPIADSFDLVSINLTEKLPYKIWMEANPNKIMLQLYGVQSNTNWINQYTNTKAIKNMYFNQTEDDVVTVTIDLSTKQHWGFSTAYHQNTLQIKVKHTPKPSLENLVIAIDAGHGGTNFGTVGSNSKVLEKDYTLLFAKALETVLLKQGATVIMTRTTDTTFDNKDRILFLQQHNPDLLISLHLNASVKPEIQGVSTYYKQIGFKPLSVSILKRMLDTGLKEFGNIGNFNFTLNAITDFPNCLVEIGFLSNKEDEEKILNPKFHQKVAQSIYWGIKDFLKNSKDMSAKN